jgi:hypothetical protein
MLRFRNIKLTRTEFRIPKALHPLLASKSGHHAAPNVAVANQHLFLLETENISDQVIRLVAFDYEIRHIVVV